jgi:hypothetical protein
VRCDVNTAHEADRLGLLSTVSQSARQPVSMHYRRELQKGRGRQDRLLVESWYVVESVGRFPSPGQAPHGFGWKRGGQGMIRADREMVGCLTG